jgi:hypothetical protein
MSTFQATGAILAIALATLGSATWAIIIAATRPWLTGLGVLVLAGTLVFESLTVTSLVTAGGGHYSPGLSAYLLPPMLF